MGLNQPTISYQTPPKVSSQAQNTTTLLRTRNHQHSCNPRTHAQAQLAAPGLLNVRHTPSQPACLPDQTWSNQVKVKPGWGAQEARVPGCICRVVAPSGSKASAGP